MRPTQICSIDINSLKQTRTNCARSRYSKAAGKRGVRVPWLANVNCWCSMVFSTSRPCRAKF